MLTLWWTMLTSWWVLTAPTLFPCAFKADYNQAHLQAVQTAGEGWLRRGETRTPPRPLRNTVTRQPLNLSLSFLIKNNLQAVQIHAKQVRQLAQQYLQVRLPIERPDPVASSYDSNLSRVFPAPCLRLIWSYLSQCLWPGAVFFLLLTLYRLDQQQKENKKKHTTEGQ